MCPKPKRIESSINNECLIESMSPLGYLKPIFKNIIAKRVKGPHLRGNRCSVLMSQGRVTLRRHVFWRYPCLCIHWSSKAFCGFLSRNIRCPEDATFWKVNVLGVPKPFQRNVKQILRFYVLYTFNTFSITSLFSASTCSWVPVTLRNHSINNYVCFVDL